jgi:hypothetical protein
MAVMEMIAGVHCPNHCVLMSFKNLGERPCTSLRVG